MIEIPGYYLKRTIGSGGMATVYLAVQESLDREVALKVMAPSLSADETFAARFRREARTIGRLSHPNIVQIYDVGTTDDNHNYFSMQYLPGGTLKPRLSQRLDEIEIFRVFTGVLRALGFAHELGFVHRDVKPENILFDPADTPILTDFGIARAVRSGTRITQTGMSVGTSRYMSPEQARGGKVDARSDLYALGVVLYEAITGMPPFEAEDTFAVAYAHVNEPIPELPPRARGWDSVIQRALAKDPRERFPSAEAFIATLEEMARTPDAGGRWQGAARTGITRIFGSPGWRRPWWKFWRRGPKEAKTEEMRTPLAIPSAFSRRMLARIRPWLPSFLRRPVWRLVQSVDQTLTNMARRRRRRRAQQRQPWVFFGDGLVLVVAAAFVWWMTIGPRPDGERVVLIDGNAGTTQSPGASLSETSTNRSAGSGADEASTPPESNTNAAEVDPEAGESGESGGDPSTPEDDGERTGARDAAAVPDPDATDDASTEALLSRAGNALSGNRLTTPAGDNALALFEQVLRRDAGNPEALAGLHAIVERYMSLAQTASQDNDPARAAVMLMRARQVAASHSLDGATDSALDEATDRTFQDLMASGRAARDAGDVAAARDAWMLAGRLDPDSPLPGEALAGLEEGGNINGRFRDQLADDGPGPELVTIPAGQFQMGSEDSGNTEVRVTRPFAMSRREVTVADFRQFVEQSGYNGADHGCEVYENRWVYNEQFDWRAPGFPQNEDFPVVCVSWNDAQAYVAWLSVRTGESYRLPSEAEWEYALRTGTDLSGDICSLGNVGDLWLKGRYPREEAFDCADGTYFTTAAGKWSPDAHGLFDMVGNVREWTLDCWNRTHRGRPDNQTARLSGDCGDRVIKGSSWLTGRPGIDPGHRLGASLDDAYNAVGFRVVREIEPSSGE